MSVAHNEAALHSTELSPQVQILRLFEAHEEELFEAAAPTTLAVESASRTVEPGSARRGVTALSPRLGFRPSGNTFRRGK